jgi:tetraacyldisaccharide 4'-kinase
VSDGRAPGLRERLWWSTSPSGGDRLITAPLLLAEGIFRGAAAARGALFDSGILPAARAGVPVISVGNLAVGGAGKTPVALAIAGRLVALGRRPAVLSRGYGAGRSDDRVVSDGERLLLDAAGGGDEPVLMARRIPGLRVLCGASRARLAPRAVALGADVLLLDDGFQHRRLARDLDVVVLDASNPWGNGHCLPAGPNREPRSALGRAGLVWLTHADRATTPALEELRALAARTTGRAPVESRHAPRDLADGRLERTFPLSDLAGRRVGLLTGVARPGSVRRTVESLGAAVVAVSEFPDHHRFTEAEVAEALRSSERAGADLLVTTEKDAVRLPAAVAGDPRIRVVRIDVEVLQGGEVLGAALAGALLGGAQRRGKAG